MDGRNTIQRSLVMQTASALCHPTADEIYSVISKEHPTISRGTVYRNLNVLETQGRLRRVSVPDGADRFDITLEKHYHVRCRKCGRVEDVYLASEPTLTLQVPHMEGFVIEEHDITFKGLCPACMPK